MLQIHKYGLTPMAPYGTSEMVSLPDCAEILSLQLQRGVPVIWARVDIDKPKRRRLVYVYHTGSNCDGSLHMDYLGSIQYEEGTYILHYFITR